MTQLVDTADPVKAYLAAAEALVIAMSEGQIFINADIIGTMRTNGWPDIPGLRHMGSMLLRLRRRGYVEKTGVRSSRSRSHGGVTSEWRRTPLRGDPIE
ncbi:hypothetical protein AB0L57_14980 [Nocardia sp. NPDC052254]|uniref:hypothetical protein n=1 Tax=Nocardia sp. NPDC052254 TaxID=3155681 RepID=UPI0034292F29